MPKWLNICPVFDKDPIAMIKRTAEMVVEELQRRRAEGNSLKSGDNRGDWLYASAINRFGSWGAAVEAAGYEYEEVRGRPMTGQEVIVELRKLAAEGDQLVGRDHPQLHRPAIKLFGSWLSAIKAAGVEVPDRRKWPPERVIELIRQDITAGCPMGGQAVINRNRKLYAAAKRQFGSWRTALEFVRSAEGDASPRTAE